MPSPTAANMAITLCDWWNRLTKLKEDSESEIAVGPVNSPSTLCIFLLFPRSSQLMFVHLEYCRQVPSPGYGLCSSYYHQVETTHPQPNFLNCLSDWERKKGGPFNSTILDAGYCGSPMDRLPVAFISGPVNTPLNTKISMMIGVHFNLNLVFKS